MRTVIHFLAAVKSLRADEVAELGAAFLCSHAGIYTEAKAESASYLAGWLKAFKSDPKVLFTASAAAQKGAEFILDFSGGVGGQVTGEAGTGAGAGGQGEDGRRQAA